MIGQGRPLSTHRATAAAAPTICWCWAVWLFACGAAATGAELRIRAAWGGPQPRAWEGSLTLSEGEFRQHRLLGLATDSPLAVFVKPDAVRIDQSRPQTYDGLELLIDAPSLDAVLTVQLTARDFIEGRPRDTLRVDLPLRDLLSANRTGEPLDSRGNQLLVRRAPGDWLRFAGLPDALVFSPGETLKLQPQLRLTRFAPRSECRLQMEVIDAQSARRVSSQERAVTIDEQGNGDLAEPLQLALPETEGVYDVVFNCAVRKRIGAPFARSPQMSRKVQLTVVSPELPETEIGPWKVVETLDPANPTWREWLNRLVQFLPGFDPAKPLGNGGTKVVRHLQRDMVQLNADGWQVYPLPISRPHTPHIVEIEYPSNVPQSLAISLIQSDGAGRMAKPGVDSGVEVPRLPAGEEPTVRVHRLVFWPRDRSPLLLLNNRRSSAALFGSIRVLSQPDRLANPAPRSPQAAPQRVAAAYFDKPLFAENFSSRTAFDDWLTFYRGSQRLAEYLHYSGYNAAVVCVAREGGALYPSRTLQPTPLLDSGVFFDSGQDPHQKDVLELMFRIFDREGLLLTPAIHFSAVLPELEELRARGGALAADLDLIGPEGRVLAHPSGAPGYNPMSRPVQDAMRRVIVELVERYSHHRSFGGVAVQLGPDTYSQLPNEYWGLDDETISRFAQETNTPFEDQGPQRFAQRAQQVRSDANAKWLAWRAGELGKLFQAMQEDLSRRKPGARLLLCGADLLEASASQRALAPSVLTPPDVELAALRAGIDARLLRRLSDQMLLLRPLRIAPPVSLASQAVNLSLLESPEADAYFGGDGAAGLAPTTGALWHHEPVGHRLPEFDRNNPLGPNTPTLWLSQFASSGPQARFSHARSLAALDAQWLLVGGRMLPLGQEDFVRPWLDQYRSLPVERFEAVRPRSGNQGTQPLTVRRRTVGQRTCVYVVNDSPWLVGAELELGMPPNCRLTDAAGQPLPGVSQTPGRRLWSLNVPPYGLIVGWLTAPGVDVIDWQVRPPAGVVEELQTRLRDVQQRASHLASPAPLQGLINPSFEKPATVNASVPGWQVAAQGGAGVTLDPQTHNDGAQSLRISSRPNAWVQVTSNEFPAPPTGRVYVFAWLRVQDPKLQPQLRVLVRGDNNSYRRYLNVGSGQQFSLQDDWKDGFLFPFDQIPSDVKNLTLEFAATGDGVVWLDGVQLYDYWFNRQERNKLVTQCGAVNFDLERLKAVGDCQRYLDSYWPRFLREFVPDDPLRAALAPGPPQPPIPQEPPRRRMERVRNALDNLPFSNRR